MPHDLNGVHLVYVGSLTGEQQFGQRLVRALQELGRFEFIADQAHADAMLEAHGGNTEQGFAGSLTFRDPHGAVIWSDQAVRPHGTSGPMAYERLVADLQAALPPLGERSHSA